MNCATAAASNSSMTDLSNESGHFQHCPQPEFHPRRIPPAISIVHPKAPAFPKSHFVPNPPHHVHFLLAAYSHQSELGAGRSFVSSMFKPRWAGAESPPVKVLSCFIVDKGEL